MVTPVCIAAEDYSTWSYYAPIKLNTTSGGANVSGTVSNFPVLIRITASNKPSTNFFSSETQSSGQDIRFAKASDHTDHFPYEIERWDQAGSLAEIWVLVDEVTGNTNSEYIRMYWGNGSASDNSSPSSVFTTSDNFSAVWHLSEDGSETADAYKDATSNGNHGTGVSMTTSSDVTCVIGMGQEFDGTNDYIEDADAENFIDGLSAITISAWIQADATGTDDGFIHTSTNASDDEHSMRHDKAGKNGSGTNVIKTGIITTGGEAWVESSNSSQTTLWQFVAVTWSSGSVSKLYLDGSEDTPTFASLAQTGTTTGSSFLRMGYHGQGLWDGKIDEVRVSNTSRSADWIKLCYENQKASQTLTEIQSAVAQGATLAAQYEKVVRFTFSTESLNLSADVADIPLLLRIDGDDIDFSVTKADGSDLLFMDSDDQPIYHEVIHWDKGNDSALVWVKETNMENTDGDIITMYYGCSDCSHGFADADNVWSGYAGVWHLNAPEATATDASSQGNDGIYQRSMPFNSGVTTVYAPSFDGSADYIDAGDNGDQTTGNFTLIAWVNPDQSPTATNWALNKQYSTESGFGFGINSSGRIYAVIDGGSAVTSTNDGTALTADTWTHIAAAFDRSGNLTRYYNGASTGTADDISGASGSVTNARSLFLGASENNGTANGFFKGRLSEVRLATSLLSANYIKLSYENQKIGSETSLYSTGNVSGPVNVTGLQLWLKADADVEEAGSDAAEDGDLVLNWLDQANSNDAAQATSGNRPTYQTDEINGLPVVRFDGSDDYMTVSMAQAQPMTIFLVMAAQDFTTGADDALWWFDDASGARLFVDDSDNDYVKLYDGTSTLSGAAAVSSKGILYTAILNGSGSAGEIFLDGTSKADGGDGTDALAATLYLGSDNAQTANMHLDGDIAEILVYNSALGSADRAMVTNYLMERYGLGPPNNASTLSGSQVSGGIKLSWTRPVSIDSRVDTVGIWVRSDTYPDSSRNGMLVGYFSTDDSTYTWPAITTATYYFTLLTRDSNGVWSNTTSAAQTSVSFTGTSGSSGTSAKKITLNTTSFTTNDLTNFPLLVRLTSSNFTFANSTDDGRDIRFLASNETDELYFEIEKWDDTGEEALLWVRVPTVTKNSTTQYIYMTYGDASLTSASNPSSTFDSDDDFLLVAHMDDNSDLDNSTGLTVDGTSNGNTADGTGEIGGAQTFDGDGDYVSFPHHANITADLLDGTDGCMFSAWINSDTDLSGSRKNWISKGRSWGGANDQDFSLWIDGDKIEIEVRSGGSWREASSSVGTFNENTWYHIAIRIDATTAYFYRNGSALGTASYDYDFEASDDSPAIHIGASNASNEEWTGELDEERIESHARTADWVKFCYENQKSGSTVLTLTDATLNSTGIIYVDSALGNNNNGCIAAEDPATPKLTVASAMICSKPSGVDTVKIMVMPGTYTDNSISNGSHPVMVKGFDPNNPPIFAGSSSGKALTIGADVHLRNISVRVATASDIGIQVTANDDEVTVVGCRVYNNSGITMSKGIHIDGTGGTDILIANNIIEGGSGYAIDVESNTEVNIVNNVLTRSSGTLNYGIYSSSISASHISITNNIIRNADVGIYTSDIDDDIGLISHNLYFNVATQTDGASGADDTDDGPVTGDPLFVSTDIENADAFKLLSGSPAIDAGTASLSTSTPFSTVPTEDLWGEDRTYGSFIDIGAYEGPGYSTQLTGELASLTITEDGGANTITIQNANWKIVFDDGEGGGIAGFYDMDNSGTNLLTGSNPLFDVSVGGTRMSSKTAYAPTLLSSNSLHATVRSTVDIDGTITANVTYNVYASGHIAIQCELRNTTGFASENKQTVYYAELSSSTEWDNDGDEKGYGILTLSNNRDLYAGVTTDLTQPSAATWTIASASDQITWTSSALDIDFAANQYYQHHFLFYVGSESLDADDAANIYSDAYAPSRLDVSTGSLTASESWQDFLRGQWPMNEGTGTTASDVSGNARNGTISGATWTSGKSGAGLNFDANDEKVTIADNDDFEIGAGRTYMIWAYVPASWSGSETQANLFSKWNNSGSTGWAITRVSGSDKIQVQVDSYTAADPDNNPTAQWIHIAGVLTSSNVLELYIDGIRKQRTTGVSGTANTQSVIIGDNGITNRMFSGQLDDARIYHQAMAQEQIQAIYNQGYSPKQGAHMVRANNNNRFITVLNPDGPATRFQPVFIIDNWYGDAVPMYVYVDGVQMTPNTDFLSALESKIVNSADMGNRLEIQFNRTFSEQNVDIFIADADSSGFMGVSNRMKQLNTAVTAGDKITVKNTTETTFGDAGSNQWQLVIDLDASAGTADGDGGINEWYSSEASPNTAIASATDITGDDPTTLDQFRFDDVATSGDEWSSGVPGSTYSINDSSITRLKLSMGSMQINGGTPDVTVSRTYTIYPTGRIFISNTINPISAQPLTSTQIYLADFTNMSSASDLNSAANAATEGRMGKLYDGSTAFHGFGVSALTVTSDGSTVTGATAIGTATLNSTNMAFNFTNSYFHQDDVPITVNYMIDFAQNYDDANTLDSVLSDVQDPGALTAIVGSAIITDAMDFNTDGFAEGEGVYTYQAASGIANFSMDISPARFYPAFKITSWNVGILPDVVMVDNQEKVLGYHFNASVVGNDRELIIQFNEVYRPTDTKTTANFYIAQQDGLAVTLSEFRAIPGVGADTLRWITESEVDNLGFYLERRIKPCYPGGARNIQYPRREERKRRPMRQAKPGRITNSQISNKSQSAKGGNHKIPRESGESADGAALPNLEIGYSLLDIGTSAQPPYDASRWTPSRDTLKGAPPYILPEHCLDSEPLVVAGLAKLQGGSAAFDTAWKRVNPRLIPGPEDGRSGSTRKYHFVDRTAKFGVTYQYYLVSVDFNGIEERFGPVEATPINPLFTRLYQNAPNPFNPSTSIRFDLKEKAPVKLYIYNINGKLIRRLVTADKPLLPGQYRYIWDARDGNGRQVASGHYIYFFACENYKKARKMTLIK